jgi:hypothetical protein
LTRCARPIRMLPGGRSAVREFKVGSTEMPVVWLGTSVFAGAGGFAEKAEEYHSRFYDNPDAMYGCGRATRRFQWHTRAE